MAKDKDMYKRSKECVHLEGNTFACVRCTWYDHLYSYCTLASKQWNRKKD